ncbi:MAG: glutamate-5-semialdehyde dehydrogenase [Pseudomonadota bacterium]
MNDTMDIATTLQALGANAQRAFRELGESDGETRNLALRAAADAIEVEAGTILDANRADVAAGRGGGLSDAMLDRLALDEQRLAGIAGGLRDIATLDDPIQKIDEEWERPNGLRIQRVKVPLGVIGIIYESRPNVTADAAGLCIKSGNAAILRGGSESFNSSRALLACLHQGLQEAGLPIDAVQMIPTRDRAAVGYLLSSMADSIDVVVPRGGRGLIERVQQDARVPVIGHLEGICHVYLDRDADVDKAARIAVNAKMRRTGVCGAAETLLVDAAAADTLLPPVADALREAGCRLRGDAAARAQVPFMEEAVDEDWGKEFLDAVIAVRVVDGLDGALEHIANYGSGHTESIVTENPATADAFLRRADSAILMHNASTQFADGGEFGMGAEIGIATGRIHARGPVGAEQLTSYKYVVRGDGQIRPA